MQTGIEAMQTAFRKQCMPEFLDKQSTVSGVGRGGERRNVPPPETGKIVVEIWCYLPEVYTFGEKSEIQEIFSKKWKKVKFP